MTTPRRIFTKEFRLGQRVSVIRSEHGWHDGEISGEIVEISENSCVVRVSEGHLSRGERWHAHDLIIRHCRDICPE